MKKTIWLATNSEDKIKEFNFLLDYFEIKTLKDIDKNIDIVEDGITFVDNAMIKAKYLSNLVKGIIIADDSGLCINNLNGFPGVHSKRWAGENISDWNIINNKLLDILKANDLNTIEKRSAYFNCTLAMIDTDSNISEIFEGKVDGYIGFDQAGSEGFAYDKVFIPNGYDKTFAQLGFEIKQQLSHRSIAIKKLANHLKNNYKF
ncbi:RdgB/HAM1 family non-canonical purine NTP pyrophosphatase [Spiroplasma tabanidicola]|uniref:dITP/XTP pyrophosphatase n=1 Tax=Spiroplasma tabanidicola TaxID=324079 RepID=A0A6I6CIH7_9MOLU|nr:RdgB/HAM1 family non-canonical purine NTP pyrophosphatase [Spiroplasma tabanidicola]QGS51863.1 dITP/XTP pyrophosphatase [Spiroplasma tabanidicola]